MSERVGILSKVTRTVMINRKFQPASEEWIHIATFGEHPHAEAGIVQVVDQESVRTQIAEFEGQAAAPNFPGLLLDQDHFSYDTSKPSRACGWISALKAQDDGLWGYTKFTKFGHDLVEAGDYRNVSPVFSKMERLGGNRVRPIQLAGAALVNAPNIKNMTPISNRAPRAVHGSVPKLRDLYAGRAFVPVLELVNDLRRARAARLNRPVPFEEAFNLARPIINRLNALHFQPEKLLSMVEAEEPAARGKISNRVTSILNRSSNTARGDHRREMELAPYTCAVSDRCLARPDLDVEAAWADLQSSEPVMYVACVLVAQS
jgi:hypothetical protein